MQTRKKEIDPVISEMMDKILRALGAGPTTDLALREEVGVNNEDGEFNFLAAVLYLLAEEKIWKHEGRRNTVFFGLK